MSKMAIRNVFFWREVVKLTGNGWSDEQRRRVWSALTAQVLLSRSISLDAQKHAKKEPLQAEPILEISATAVSHRPGHDTPSQAINPRRCVRSPTRECRVNRITGLKGFSRQKEASHRSPRVSAPALKSSSRRCWSEGKGKGGVRKQAARRSERQRAYLRKSSQRTASYQQGKTESPTQQTYSI